MWLKLVLVIVYVTVLFVLARMLEAVTWVESGNISRRLLDPMTMSVLKLKALLEQRGISYEGAVEKKELSELVESTGPVTEEAIVETSLEESSRVTNFTGEAHFLEQVEDSKDSVWLVQVLSKGRHLSILTDSSWQKFRKKMSHFGVNIGVFDCYQDWQFCSKKGWQNSQLILGLPQEFKTKAVVKLYSYEGPYRQQYIFNWIKNTVYSKIYQIHTQEELRKEWLMFRKGSSHAEVRLVMFSGIKNAPLFFSALSVKFPGRVKFGIMNNISLISEDLLTDFGFKTPPRYMVITAEKSLSYGNKPSEHITFDSLEFFLKMLYPSLNDIFVLSLGICNFTTLFEPFLVQGSVMKRLFKFICCVIKHNTYLLLAWIILLAIFQLNTLSFIIEFGLKCIRIIGLSELGSYMRQDYCFYSAHKYFNGFSFIIYVSIVGILAYRFKDHEAEEFNPNEWNFAQFRTLEHLFFPTASLFMTSQRSRFVPFDYEEDPILNIFHSSMIQTDYIQNLPVWNYIPLPVVSYKGDITYDTEIRDSNAPTVLSSEPQKAVVFLQKDASEESDKTSSMDKGDKSNFEVYKQSDLLKKESKKAETQKTKSPETVNENISSYQATGKYPDAKKSAVHGAPAGMYVETQCGICLDAYETGTKLCGLPCGHCFHQTCIVAWLMKDNHLCPFCRWPSYKVKQPSHLHSE